MSDDKRGVVWAGPPDPEHGLYYPIVSPKPNKRLELIILSDVIHGVMTHWIIDDPTTWKGHTHPCLGSRELCVGCDLRLQKRWKGYLGCWDRRAGRLVLAEVTREAYLRCPHFEVLKGQLRGRELFLARSGDAKNARVTAEIREWRGCPGSLPPCFNVKAALERIWFGEPGKGGQAVD